MGGHALERIGGGAVAVDDGVSRGALQVGASRWGSKRDVDQPHTKLTKVTEQRDRFAQVESRGVFGVDAEAVLVGKKILVTQGTTCASPRICFEGHHVPG